ncbi:hypothetical protein [uncultured Draconibacterium sp.]|uniref:hypothetical protein n=1 Tax=uncultured Draconibacterium sp. TaxID=1573823 RepID=UPI0032608B1D
MKKTQYNLLLLVAVILFSANSSLAQPVTIKLNTNNSGKEISPLALGLSYETKDLLPNLKGDYYFHPDNKALINMFQTIGVKHLRIGGNSVDANNVPLPSEKDIHTFFQFAKAADLTVVYSIRLENGTTEYARKVAAIINNNYKDLVESISIGNEPYYYKQNEVYLKKWTAIHDAILEVYPDAVFNGPDTNPNIKRMKTLVDNFANPKGRFVQLSQHSYPFGCSYKNPEVGVYQRLIPQNKVLSRDKMLNPTAYATYQSILDMINETRKGTDLSFRLSETNSYWYSGLKGVSNSYASALWGLDYLYWWTTHGAEGLDFHTGDVTGGTAMQPAFYAAFVTKPSGGYAAMPIAYGMKLFQMGSNGRVVPTEIINPGVKNIVAYATKKNDGTVYLTIINKKYGVQKNEKVVIQLDKKITGDAKAISIRAKNDDIALMDGVTIGGDEIDLNGNWKGEWKILDIKNIVDNTFELSVPNASAWLIEIKE